MREHTGIMKRNAKKTVFWIFFILSIVWMGVIFSFSAQPATKSAELSTGVVDWVLPSSTKVPVLKFLAEKGVMEFVIRKMAHAIEYGMLAICLGITISHSETWFSKWQLKTTGLCFLYASSDEFHQLFVPGRSGQVRDVVIDTVGAFGAVLILWLCGAMFHAGCMNQK